MHVFFWRNLVPLVAVEPAYHRERQPWTPHQQKVASSTDRREQTNGQDVIIFAYLCTRNQAGGPVALIFGASYYSACTQAGWLPAGMRPLGVPRRCRYFVSQSPSDERPWDNGATPHWPTGSPLQRRCDPPDDTHPCLGHGTSHPTPQNGNGDRLSQR